MHKGLIGLSLGALAVSLLIAGLFALATTQTQATSRAVTLLAIDANGDTTGPTTTITVHKNWVSGTPQVVSITLACSQGVAILSQNPQDTVSNQAAFIVADYDSGDSCGATEQVPTGFTADQTLCADLELGGGDTGTSEGGVSIAGTIGDPPIDCTIYNYLNEAYFNVQKYYNLYCSDGVSSQGGEFDPCTDDVHIELVCSTGTVEVIDDTASYWDQAEFHVYGFDIPATCTATEDPVPPGFTGDMDRCVDVPIYYDQQGVHATEQNSFGCGIYNSYNETEVRVYKDFTDGNPIEVHMYLECTSGDVTAEDSYASDPDDYALFYVNGFDVGATCTATEDVPNGYSMNNLDCQGFEIFADPVKEESVQPAGEEFDYEFCTIINGTEIFFRVYKDFLPGFGGQAIITLVCSTGAVQALDPSAGGADPADFSITGADQSTTCDAIEEPTANYIEIYNDCVDVLLFEFDHCNIVNEYVPTPSPSPTPSPTEPPPETEPPVTETPTPTPTPTPTFVHGTATESPPPTQPPTAPPTATPTPSPTVKPPTITPTVAPLTQTPQPTEQPTQECRVVLTQPAEPGDKEIEVSITSACDVGEWIRINAGGSNQEDGRVIGRGSLILECPIKVHHDIGEEVITIPGPVPGCATATPSPAVLGFPQTGGSPQSGAGSLKLLTLGLVLLALAAAAFAAYRRADPRPR